VIALKTQETLRIKPWRSARVECASGVLWVTREGEPCDFILGPGEAIEVGRGLTIALALEPSAVYVAQQPLVSQLPEVLKSLGVAIRRWYGLLASGRFGTLGTTVRS
jgi:hypothetical protein